MATTGDAVLGQFKPTEHNDSEECCCGKKLKVGIIGTGWIAEAHIESYQRMPDVEIVAGSRSDRREGGEILQAVRG